ncbi:MAG TPA: ABC transporter permease, partial [Thermoanaerobaculia bacterium]
MLRSIAKFEVKYHLKAPLFYILFAVYFLLSFAAVASNDVVSGSAISAINKNAPFLTMLFMLLMSIFGVLTTTAFVADSVHRDFDLGTDSLFFSAPITKWQYLLGRFIGSLSVAVLIYVGVAVAMFVASLMPWIDQERIGPTDLWSYVFSLFALVIPNLLLCGAIFFAVAALTRSVMATYSSVVAFFVAWGVAGALLEDMENERISALLDPFGANAFFVATRYWTIFDKNNKLLPLEGVFLWNRILWVGIALTVLAFACWRFKFTTGTRKSAKKARRNAAAEAPLELDRTPVALPPVQQTFGGAASWKAFIAATRRECLTVFKSIPFVIIVALGVANIWGNSVGIDSVFGTSFYPVTHKMITGIMEAFAVLALLIATFYAGDIVWRERSLKMHEVYDAMPTPTWAIWASKATALVLVVFAALAIATLTSILIQLGNGYTNLELGLYAKGVLLQIG